MCYKLMELHIAIWEECKHRTEECNSNLYILIDYVDSLQEEWVNTMKIYP